MPTASDVAAQQPTTTRLADYTPPDYWIDTIALRFALDPKRTTVKARLDVRRSISAPHGPGGAPLVLDGEALDLIAVSMDDAPLASDAYTVSEKHLTIHNPPEAFILETEVAIAPEANTALSGLYLSNGMFCTQCEAEGFRRITYYPDRPDVLSKYRVRIEGDKVAYPILLANGNKIDAGDIAHDRHFAEWEDPHPKPAYLFALVGGDLACVEDQFTTRSGRDVALKVFVQPKNKDKCGYTLDALKRAMRWDEERFGREYDLDIFMIVAVDHFNFGAMENKGLNIFNSAYVLASPETATDLDYENIEAIVGHEYFHNWSGNRVTLRDWFQLCLKEGFTVFRDQEFSADMRSRPVQRIKDVRRLWSNQFPEDAGPLAHPPHPSEYITIDNFYTATVYEKGAELSRMLLTLLGPEKFRRATDLYFEHHDGMAATVEDFIKAMEQASGDDLTQFRLWYTEAGTPNIRVETKQNDRILTLTLRQETKTIKAPAPAAPRAIPVAYALIGRDTGQILEDGLIHLNEAEQTYSFGPLAEPAIVSLFRSFSAPVTVTQTVSVQDRISILTHETDFFSRWNASDGLWKDLCLGFAQAQRDPDGDTTLDAFADALANTLAQADDDHALAAQILTAPSAADLVQSLPAAVPINPGAIVSARADVRHALSIKLRDQLENIYDRLSTDAAYAPDAGEAGRRGLRNAALALLVEGGFYDHAEHQAGSATNMTDESAAVSALAQTSAPCREKILSQFHTKWRSDPLVLNKWLGFCALQPGDGALSSIIELTTHNDFDFKTPNKVRALIGVFAHRNVGAFHREDGRAYDFLVDQITRVDTLNPQLAAQLTTALDHWRRLEPTRQSHARSALERLLIGAPSSNLFEMASRILGDT